MNTLSPICDRCEFAPFCTKGEKKLREDYQIGLGIKQHHLQKKETLFFPNKEFRNLYSIQQGVIKTHQIDAEGKELIRGFYFVGEIIGFEAIYKKHYLSSATALSETVLCEIPYDDFLELLQSRPNLQKQILHLISKHLSLGEYLILTTAEKRLAAFLIDLSIRLSPLKKQLSFFIPMSRQEIGSYLRLTAETISRILSRFQENEWITIDNKKIGLLQFERLQQIANSENADI